MVRFYFADKNVERPRVRAGRQTLAVNVAFPTQQASVKTYVIHEKAQRRRRQGAGADPGDPGAGAQHAGAGRGYDAVLKMAPGAARTTSLFIQRRQRQRERYLIDGLNTPTARSASSAASSASSSSRAEIVTGGYTPSTAAHRRLVNVIHKSGSNEFHGASGSTARRSS